MSVVAFECDLVSMTASWVVYTWLSVPYGGQAFHSHPLDPLAGYNITFQRASSLVNGMGFRTCMGFGHG